MSETTITVKTQDPTPAERRRQAEERRKQLLPRMFWDPQYYADPRNANVARSIMPYGPGPEQLTESQFNRAQIAAQGSMISPRMVGTMIEVLSASPTISPGVATSLAQFADRAGFDDDLLTEILTLDAEARAAEAATTGGRNPAKGSEAEKGGFLSQLTKGISRPLFALASLPVDLIQGAIRNTVGMLQDPEQYGGASWTDQMFSNPFNNAQPSPLEQSSGGQYLAGLYGPENADLGQGWFPAGDVQARAELARRESAPLVFNEYWTLGRGVGSMFFDNPDDLRYQNLSGFIDLAAAIALDPTIYIGVGAAAGTAARTAARTAAAREAGVAAGEAQTTRELITLSDRTTQLLQQARGINATTFRAANDVARGSNQMYAAAQREAAQSFGSGPLDDLSARIDEMDEQIAATQAELGATREARKAEPQKAREERKAGQQEIEQRATKLDSDMAIALDDLTMQLGDDGLDALQAKVLADSPELPGPFTDAVFVPGKRTDPNPTALPGSVDGTDAILMWNSEKSPVLRSVDDEMELGDEIVTQIKRVASRSNQRKSVVKQMTDLLTTPGVTFGDALAFAADNNLGRIIQAVLRQADIDGITDIFRITGGEGGVWWTSRNVAAGRWSDEAGLTTAPSGRVSAETYRVYDESLAGQRERLTQLRARKKELSDEQASLTRRVDGERKLVEALSDSYVSATDLRTSLADSGVAIRNSIEYSMGVRRELGGVPRISDDLLKQWLLGPTRDFDAAVAAKYSIAPHLEGAQTLNRGVVAGMTMGASEVIRGVGKVVQPFATRAREQVFEAMVKWDLTPGNLGRLQRLTSGRFDPQILKAILAAKTEDEVLAVIGPSVGVGVTRPITPGAINSLPVRMNALTTGRTNTRLFARATDWMADHYERLSSVVPRFGAAINLADAQGGANVLRNYLTNIRAIDTETADQIVGQFLDASTEVGRGRSLVTGMKTVQARLVERNDAIRGISDADKELLTDRLNSVTGVHEGARAKVQNWWLKKYAGDSSMGFMTLDGEVIPFVGPQLEAELVRGGVVLPDSQEIARAIGRWGLTLTKHPGLRRTIEVLDAGMDLWRSVILIRFAYTLRNIAEMQFRMFMTGHSSVFNHPMGAIGMASAMNKRNRTSRGLLARFAAHDKTATGKVLHEIGAEDLDVADDLVPEYVELMTRSSSRHDMRSVRAAEQSHDLIPVGVGQPGFAKGWSEKLIDLRSSRIARLVAGYNPPAIEPLLANGVSRENAIVDWLLHSDDAKWIRADYQETQSPLAQIWSDPVALRNFLFTGKGSIRERVQEYTMGREELVDFIVNGSLVRDGEEVFTMSTAGLVPDLKAKAQADRAVRLEQAIRPYLSDLPSDTEMAMRVTVPKNGFATVASEFNRAIDWFFNWNGRKENAWAVGPEFAYAYNDAAVDMMPMLNLQDRKAIYDWVLKAENRYTPHSETLMRARSYLRSPEGDLNMSDVERVAAAKANEHVKGLFYDAQQRRQLFHQLRLVMPFAQPFADTLWRWGRLMAARPYLVERFGRLGESLTDPGSGVLYDDFDWIDPFTDREQRDPTQGFIYTNPQTGEPYFTFPLIGSALGAALSPAAGFNVAESMTLGAPVQNLNLAFQGDVDYLPGVGPLISMPLSILMPDDAFGAFPEWLRDYVFPYGEPKPEGGIVESTFLPSWARRMTGALYNETFRAYSYKGMLAYMVSTQEYPGLQSSPVQQQKLIEDVQRGAKILTFIRALGAAILPAAPTQEIYAADADGRLIGSSYLATHWQHLINEAGGDYEAATKAFIDSYGMQALSAIVGSSEGDAPISGPGWEFFRKHPESDAYGDVIGYFFPGDMSLDAYQFQQESGDRRGLSVEERTDKLIQFLYNAEKTALDGRAAAELWDLPQLEQAEEDLKERYGGVVPQFSGTDSRTRLDQIRRAMDQFPALANTRGGEGAQLLFEAYDEYTETSQERYGTGLGGQKAEGMREEFLRELDSIVAQYGGQNVQDGSVNSIARLFANVVTPRGE